MNLPKVKTKSKKRQGQGYGSGIGGHTSGRGQKGQKTRASISILFEGVKVKKSFIKRLPFKRGKGKFKAAQKPLILNVEYLNILPNGSAVTIESLVEAHLVKKEDAEKFGVKILGGGNLEKKLTVKVSTSHAADEKITKAGGTVVKE